MEKPHLIHANATQPPRLLLTMREAAVALAVCEKTVSNLIRDGQIRALRIGRAVRIDVAELREFIEGRKGSTDDLHNSEVTVG
jgi:excisionase family DNA binding protein